MNKLALLVMTLSLAEAGLPRAFAAESPNSTELLEEAAFRSAVKRIRSAVVRINLIGTIATTGEADPASSTTGLIISSDGYVLTSSFAFSTPSASILITLDDGRQLAARLMAIDHSRQLALLKFEGEFELESAVYATRKELAVGQWAIAVGRDLDSEHPSVTVGILSALGRIQGKAVQTDAAISPANYGGPLIDISGRVIGVLTPLAPDDAGVGGAEWYDSGIGFAVPLDGYEKSLGRMESGEDLYRGLVGIAFAKGNPMETPATISNVRRRSPADRAGLKTGDTILVVDETATPTQALFRRAIGHSYAGDSIALTVLRREAKLKVNVELVRKLEPFRHAAVGLIAKSAPADSSNGVLVERLLPGGPATVAGIQPNDLIVAINGDDVAAALELAEALRGYAPGDDVRLRIIREGSSREMTVKLSERSAEFLAVEPDDETETDEVDLEGSAREFKLPEFATPCPLYVPASSMKSEPPGLLLVLQSNAEPMNPDKKALWQRVANRDNFVLAMPGPQDGRSWGEGDLEYVRQLLRTLLKREKIDESRVALVGTDCPNRVTLAMWLTNRAIVRGVVLGSAEMPLRSRLPENEMETPCLILASASADSRETRQLKLQLKELGFAAAVKATFTPAEIAAWADSLDRL